MDLFSGYVCCLWIWVSSSYCSNAIEISFYYSGIWFAVGAIYPKNGHTNARTMENVRNFPQMSDERTQE